MLDIQFIQGITDEAYNSRYWVGQIEPVGVGCVHATFGQDRNSHAIQL